MLRYLRVYAALFISYRSSLRSRRKIQIGLVRERVACILAALCLTGLAGCGGSLQGSPDRLFSRSEELASLRLSYGDQRVREYRSSIGSKRELIRNSIILGRLYAIDIAYGKFEAKLTRERQKLPFVATTASIALSGTGSLIADAATKSILAAVDTGLKGTKAAYDKDILVQKTIGVLQETMRSNRNQVRSKILSHLSSSDREYPLELALGDVEEYYNAGTITGGFIGVSEQSAVKLATTKAFKISTIDRFGADSATVTIRNYWRRGGDTATTRIRDWLKTKQVTVPISIFINSAAYATLRAELVRDLGL